MAEGKRKVNLHGTVKEKSEYKSYRVEATPVSSTLAGIFLIWVFAPIFMTMRFGELVLPHHVWPALLILSIPVPIYFFYKWYKFKLEKHE